MLEKRIDLLERALESYSLDVEESVARVLKNTIKDPKSRAGSDGIAGLENQSPSAYSTGRSDQSSTMETLPSSSKDPRKEVEGILTVEASLNFDQDGEFRYFGPSSGRLQFQTETGEDSENGIQDSTPKSSIQSTMADGVSARKNQLIQSVMKDIQVSAELKDHLVDLYFAWEQPWCWVINERLFRESERHGGRFCNPLLLNCILAIASRFTDRVDVRSDSSDPNTAGSLFFDNAEVLLHYDLKWPTITTIQSLSIMGTMYVAVGADAAGWLHQGMANRLAIDMGLNLDPTSMEREPIISAEEIELRRQVYWALYCHDKLFASYTGRVCTMLNFQGVVNLPKVDPSCQGREDSWSFQTDEKFPLFTIRTSFASLQYSTITLCQILERILLNLYAPQPLSLNAERNTLLASCAAELTTWHRDLPSEMRIEPSASAMRVPHVFTLHMTYHTAIILLHKPFLTATRPNDIGRKTYDPSTTNPTVINASLACCQAAESICEISEKYRQIFGSFRRCPLTATHCNLMAALVSLQIPQSSKNQNMVPFDTCATVLHELSDSWLPPKRLLQNLLNLRSKKMGIMEISTPHSDQGRDEDLLGQPTIAELRSLSNSIRETTEVFQGVDVDTTTNIWGPFSLNSSTAPFLVGDDLGIPSYTLPEDYGIFEVYNQGF
ncbi:hypothetical protein G7Y89_g15780 [Cudoniella acicularis]|uniref:Xylanolytic transcriptional activator regulatory domain-containing protein n=1 Tax=Cudoniella acicularis TaxID=354080 RepID=A0A8H4QFC3_9HELO|nr:hypothetical protein G7Y89_g15780 [Cudoniella acicularis]